MFREVLPGSLTPAWAGEGYGKLFSASDRPRRGGSGGGVGKGGAQLFASDRPRRGGSGGGVGKGGTQRRARRGEIKFVLLELLSEGSQHGYELIKELESRRGGFHRPSPGSVYPTLQLLEDGGYLTSEPVEGKRVYTMTDSGKQLLEDWKRQPGSTPLCVGLAANQSSELIELQRTLTGVNDAVTQVARTHNQTQIGQVRELLVQVQRQIYKLLSEES